MKEETKQSNEQETETPVLEGLRILGRMIAREIYSKALKDKCALEQDIEKKF